MSPGGGPDSTGSTGLVLSRSQILAHRRRIQALDARMPAGDASLQRAAAAGLQDSMPRAALLSISARVAGTRSDVLENPALVQLWGPRYSAYVVSAEDIAVFTLGRLPERGVRRANADDIAARLAAFLDGNELPVGVAGRALGIHPNGLRYAAPTGTVLIRWDGARQPTVRTAPAPDIDPVDARRELARRHLRVFGPTTAGAFADWAGIGRPEASAAFALLQSELLPVQTPVGNAWILAEYEQSFRVPAADPAAARLLPSGDTFYLLHGLQRELLEPDADRRSMLWTPRVWPGALLVGGELAGTWRRAQSVVDVEPWRALTASERDAVEAEAAGLPLPGVESAIRVRWAEGPA